MQNNYLSFQKEKLIKKESSLGEAYFKFYHFSLKRFWNEINNDPIWSDLLISIKILSQATENSFIFENTDGLIQTSREPQNELGHIIRCYSLISLCSNSQNNEIELVTARTHGAPNRPEQSQDTIRAFHDYFIKPICNFLLEEVDNKGILLSLMKIYKKKAEWFKKQELQELSNQTPSQSESSLKKNLYEFLLDKGINFSIEPNWNRSEIDIISDEGDEDRLCIEVKVVKESRRAKPSVKSGFIQIRSYLHTFSESIGFLLIYKNIEQDLIFNLNGMEKGIPYLIIDHKIIYFILIDIFPHENTPSERSSIKQIFISLEDLTNPQPEPD